MNVFEQRHGADWLKQPELIGIFLISSIFIAYSISLGGYITAVFFILIPILLAFISLVFVAPRIGVITLFILNFLVMGVYRYMQIQWGLTIDGIIILTYIALFIQSFHQKISWTSAKNELTLLAAIWYLYALFQLVNPETVNRIAWFYGMRSMSLYMILVVPLIFILFNKSKDLKLFFLIWGIFSILGSLKGMQQKIFGLDQYEQLWLNDNLKTHLLFGVVRIFSFFSDAGQFGASQGYAAVVFSILAFGENTKKRCFFYGIVAIGGFYGMMISGTRGAIGVPLGGFAFAILLRKNIRAISLGCILLVAVVVFFKYTTIGQGDQTIRRMRTAFDPNDPSLQLRLQNQQRIKVYMATRPIGGGLGTTGNYGKQYSPGSFLSSVPSDSWYVKVWMELGIVGLVLHLTILFYVLSKSTYFILFKIRDDWVKTQGIAIASGMAGMMVAAYGNGILGQFPSSILFFSGMAYLYLLPKLDEEIIGKKEKFFVQESYLNRSKKTISKSLYR
jgi:hypothetical protein